MIALRLESISGNCQPIDRIGKTCRVPSSQSLSMGVSFAIEKMFEQVTCRLKK
jgi:hypothetical protein